MTRTSTTRAVRVLVLGLLLAFGGLLLSAGPAEAVTPADATGCTTPSYVDPATAGHVIGAGCQSYPDGHDLPVLRWSGAATSLYWKADGGITKLVSDMATWLQRDGTWPLWMAIGNTMWSWATSIVSFGVRAQPLVVAGAKVDELVGGIGDALTTSGLVAFFVGVAAIVLAWRTYRQHRFPWAQAGRVILVIALLVSMTAGAQASTTDSNGKYAPGVMSPGWTVNLINTTISTLASAPAALISEAAFDAAPSVDLEAGVDGGNGSCERYVDAMVAAYESGARGDGKLMSSITVSMSRMWEQTGLEAWKTAQFGSGPYGDFMYCRLLEMRSQIPASEQIALSTTGSALPAANTGSGAWGTGDDAESLDRSLVAWAACRPTADGTGWQVASDWDQVNRSRGAVTAEDCAAWWTDSFFVGVDYKAAAKAYLETNPDGFHVGGAVCAPGVTNTLDCWTTEDLGWSVDQTAEAMAWGGVCEYSKWRQDNGAADCYYVEDDGSTREAGTPICTSSAAGGSCLDQASGAVGGILKDDGSPFYWGASANSAINETGSAPAARSYLLALHGSSNLGGTLATTLTYAIGSVVVLVTFGMLGIGVFIAKLWALVVMVSLFFTLLRDVIFTNEPSSTVKLFKQYLGISFFAFGLQLVFSLVTLFTGLLVAMGSDWFEPGSVTSMAWLAMAPAVSVFILHTVFTKTLKLPSPFTVNGVKTWGAAAAGGAVGGAMGSGLGRWAGSAARRAAWAGGRSLGDLAGLGMAARVGARKPRAGAFTAAAAGAGAGGAAGAVTGAWAGGRRRPGARRAADPAWAGSTAQGAAAAMPAPSRAEHAAARRASIAADQEALLDGATMTQDAALRDELRAGRAERRQTAVERRGYDPGRWGDAREIVAEQAAQRWQEVGARFRAKPVRTTLSIAAKPLVVVGTGGLALPFMAAGALRRDAFAAVRARRVLQGDAEYRRQAQRAAAAAAGETSIRPGARPVQTQPVQPRRPR